MKGFTLKMKWIFLLSLMFFLLINNAVAQDLQSETKVELEPKCYSNNVLVTRFFYIPNKNINNFLPLKAMGNRYLLFIGHELNPKIISIKDNYGVEYPKKLQDLGDIDVIDFLFPEKDLRINPRDEFLITVKYEARSNAILNEDGVKVLELKSYTIGDKNLSELRIIIPKCFGYNREFIDAFEKPDQNSVVDDKLILVYDKPLLESTFNITEINRSNAYDPSVRYKYKFNIFGVIFFIVTSIIAFLIGLFIDRAFFRGKGWRYYFDFIKSYVKKVFTKNKDNGKSNL